MWQLVLSFMYFGDAEIKKEGQESQNTKKYITPLLGFTAVSQKNREKRKETETIIIVSVFSAAWAALLIMAIVLFAQVGSLRRRVNEMQATGRIRVQKLRMNNDKNHAFHNPALSPDEELARRGYSMYVGDDVEAAHGRERQTGGQLVEELERELDNRQQRQSTAPPFLLQSIEENKRRSRSLNNPVANSRQSDTNPNFIY